MSDLFVDNWSQEEFLYSCLVIAFIVYCFYVLWRGDDRQIKVAIVALAMVFNILLFGLFNESGMLLPLIPVGVLLVVDMSKGQRQTMLSRTPPTPQVDPQA